MESLSDYTQEIIIKRNDLKNDIKKLQSSIGYSEHFDKESKRILFTLKSLVTVKITNTEKFSDYRKNLIKIKNKYYEDPDSYSDLCEELWPKNDYFGTFLLCAKDHNFIEKIEKTGKEDWESLEKIICDECFPSDSDYPPSGIPFDFKHITYKFSDLAKAIALLDDLTNLYMYTYINENNDKNKIISKINEIKNSITDEYNDHLKSYLNELAYIIIDSIRGNEDCWKKKDELENILNDLLEIHNYLRETIFYEEKPYLDHKLIGRVDQVTSQYLKAEWMHTKKITKLVLLNLFDIEYLELKSKLSTVNDLNNNASSKIIEIATLLIIIILSYYDYNYVSWLLAAFIIPHYISRKINEVKFNYENNSNREKDYKFKIKRELFLSENYNNEVIVNRLKNFEKGNTSINNYIHICLGLHDSH